MKGQKRRLVLALSKPKEDSPLFFFFYHAPFSVFLISNSSGNESKTHSVLLTLSSSQGDHTLGLCTTLVNTSASILTRPLIRNDYVSSNGRVMQ